MASLRASLAIICAAAATIVATSTGPTVTLDSGLFTGTTANGTSKFLGIRFAKPPVGDLRFRRPHQLDRYVGEHNATAFGLACPQQATNLSLPSEFPQETLEYLALLFPSGVTTLDGEDCLTINVFAPADATPGSKLPVIVWVHGGGFQGGSSASYDGSVIVNRSMALREPVIVVTANYRLSALGFLASQEVKDARVGNLGLWDQRLAFRWVQKYIYAFGGDPSKVTISGESAGAMSVSLHMLANGRNTEGLFRAAFMESGSPLPIGDITHGQPNYDFIVEHTGCSNSSDTLECLRAAPYDELKAAMDSTPSLFSYQSLAMVWQPRVDKDFLADDPQKLVLQGRVARIPFVTGDCDDEGTLFSLSQLNVTTQAELRTYLSEFYFPKASDAEMDELLTLYPQNVTQGSPYDTGTQNALTPQFKQIASILGDYTFQAPRRLFLNSLSRKQHTWSFLSKREKSVPNLGSFHGSDILNIWSGGDLADFLIQFATHLNPNGVLKPEWPRYTTSSPQLMTFLDNQATNRTITPDTYRVEGMELITILELAHPL